MLRDKRVGKNTPALSQVEEPTQSLISIYPIPLWLRWQPLHCVQGKLTLKFNFVQF